MIIWKVDHISNDFIVLEKEAGNRTYIVWFLLAAFNRVLQETCELKKDQAGFLSFAIKKKRKYN